MFSNQAQTVQISVAQQARQSASRNVHVQSDRLQQLSRPVQASLSNTTLFSLFSMFPLPCRDSPCLEIYFAHMEKYKCLTGNFQNVKACMYENTIFKTRHAFGSVFIFLSHALMYTLCIPAHTVQLQLFFYSIF